MTARRTALFISLALCAAPVFAAESISKVNGSITAETGQAYGELETVNGSIHIASGASTDDAGTVNGGIDVGDKATVGALETVNGGIKLGRDVTVDGSIETVNGSIFVDRGGKVKGGVETVNGAIGLVGTHLGGDIATVRGNVTVGIDSHVAGGLRVEKSSGMFNLESKKPQRIIIGPNAVVEGPLVFEREVTLYVHRTAKTGKITGATATPYATDTAPQD